MAPSHDTRDNLIRSAAGRTFTLSEACEFMQTLDSMPTPTFANDVNWVNAKTGQPVVIGYSGGGGYKKGEKNKKKNTVNPFLEVNNKQMFNALSKMHSKKIKYGK